LAKYTYVLIWLNTLMGESLNGQQHKIEKNTGPQLRAQESEREGERVLPPASTERIMFDYGNINALRRAVEELPCTGPKLCPSDLEHPGH
jgi:hypothetical protein